MTAEQARRWCVEVGLPGLAALPAGGDPTPWVDGLLEAARAGDAGLVRPAVARALAERASHPAVLPALAAYVRAAPIDEALEFATDWADDAWQAFCAAPAGGADALTAALVLAGLAIAHGMETTAGPPFDKEGYNAAVRAARDLFVRLARCAPPPGTAPASLLSGLLAGAQARATDLGFTDPIAARIPRLVRVCRDFGESLPRGNPGLRYLS